MTSASEQRPDGDLALGELVLTSDGKRLGTVKEFHGPYFKVDAPHRLDYWLQQSVVHRESDGKVVAEFAESDLHAYEVKDIDSDEDGDALNRTDASLLGESGLSTDMTTAPEN